MQIHQLFPTTILKDNINRPFTKAETDFYQNAIYRPDISNSTESPHRINLSLDHAVLENAVMANIKEFIMQRVNHYMFNVMQINDRVTFYISRSWFIQSKKGDFGRRHDHPNSILSGIFYFRAPVDCGNIMFYENKTSKFGSMQFGFTPPNALNSTHVSVPPTDGTMIIFPSALAHEISINQADETRYSMAFDIWVKGTMGVTAGDGTTLTL